ncbi:hypothetical protein OJF2_51040 [Aquisphaera giovannonii]|uniref:Uncharacterized protein n=1 Tax=Aquisphaera giovannonii TaxID=406548 RepID=A0A5B9W9L3_9BACT|nr:hypothetical protein [Aquisphaera giovannonii]QEH36520.1 hypothetical protein OJF2_51040 [Aquisphaera giovannonii]
MYQKGESGNPEGRPKVTLEDLPEGWAEKALALYREGASDVEIRAEVFGGMSNDLWTRLMAEEQLFSETISAGRALSEAWWTKKGRTSLDRKDFQDRVYALHMMNRFRWDNRISNDTKLTGPNGGPIETKHSGAVAVDLQSKSLDELTKLFTEKLKT